MIVSMLAPLLLALGTAGAPAAEWRDYSDAVFADARRENRFVLLDLGAVWCHWCHVMEETTYRDPRVIALIGARFIPVRVDQDARPDLSNRYEDYGWPATVIFDPNGRELVKFSGYIPPPRMLALLEAVVTDPTPGPSISAETELRAAPEPRLSAPLKAELEELLVARYDTEHGGWGFAKKFLDWDGAEWSLLRGQEGDAEARGRALETLRKQIGLIDPVWGGVYQYSDGGVWENPHFEKLIQFQAENLRLYSLAFATTRDARFLQAARDILRYMRDFLRGPEGAFYVSQDADLVQGEHAAEYFALADAERRRRGIPRVDTHLYTRENGWAIAGLVAFHRATGDATALEDALRAARFIVAERALLGGGFRHDALDPAGPYLGDSLAAGRAFLALYEATGERAWLERAAAAVAFAARTFRRDGVPGYVTAAGAGALASGPQRDENVQMVRLAAALARHSSEPRFRAFAEEAMRYLAIPEVARRFSSAAALLADRDLR